MKITENGMGQLARKIKADEPSIVALNVSKAELVTRMSDGRTISVPTSWFHRLANAPIEKLRNFEISPSGYGIHWPDLDEDVSIKSFIDP